MKRCKKCGMPNTHPRLLFKNDICQACINYDKRKYIDWKKRENILMQICDLYRKKDTVDCLIAVSGGKDSYWLCDYVVNKLGMHPILFTVNDFFTKTKAGIHNLNNLIKKFGLGHYAYSINYDLFKRATRWSFEQRGVPLDFVECAIYTMSYSFAKMFSIPLVFFGEHSLYEYGAIEYDYPFANMDIWSITKKFHYGVEFWVKGGLTETEVHSILPIVKERPLCIYMSYFTPWSSEEHLKVALKLGFRTLENEWEREGYYDNYEQIDSVGYVHHLWHRVPRMGFGRGQDIVSRRIREGKITLEEGLDWVEKNDKKFDTKALYDFINTLGYSWNEYWNILLKAKWNKHYKITIGG